MYDDFSTTCAKLTVLHDTAALVGRKMQHPQKWPKNAKSVCWLGCGISLPASLLHRSCSTSVVTIQACGVFIRTRNSQWERLHVFTLKAWQSGTPLPPVDWLCAIYKVQPGLTRWMDPLILFTPFVYNASIQPGACCVCAFSITVLQPELCVSVLNSQAEDLPSQYADRNAWWD